MKVPALIFKDKSDLGNTAGLPLKNCNLGSVKDIVYAKLGFKAMSTVVGTWYLQHQKPIQLIIRRRTNKRTIQLTYLNILIRPTEW